LAADGQKNGPAVKKVVPARAGPVAGPSAPPYIPVELALF